MAMDNKIQNDDMAVSVKNVYKDFSLPHERKNSLKERILRFNKKTTYDKLRALKNVSFDIKKGEFFGVVGRNGSGKSTLLKIIGGIYQPTRGTVTVNGTLTPFIELGIGFNPELTGRENVFLNGAILGLTRREIVNKYQEIVDFAELERFMDQKLKNYSSGMQVRLAFAIAIQAHNDILLIDEVLAVGDANFQRKCFQIFRQIKESGRTVIFVTHAMNLVEEFCDRALMIQDSEVTAIGSPREIALRYELANSAAAAGGTTGVKLQRPTNPAIKISGFKLMNQDKATNSFTYHDDLIAEVTLDVKRPLEVQVNLFLISADGEYYAGLNSNGDFTKKFKPDVGKHVLRCKIPVRQLLKGDYSVGVGVYSQDYAPDVIDVIDHAYTSDVPRISVLESSKYQDGKFYMTGKWSEVNKD